MPSFPTRVHNYLKHIGVIGDHATQLTNIGTNTHAQIDTTLGALGTTYAPIAKSVTNGDTHDHVGGDGAQIDHAGLANKGTNTHAQIDDHIANAITGSIFPFLISVSNFIPYIDDAPTYSNLVFCTTGHYIAFNDVEEQFYIV